MIKILLLIFLIFIAYLEKESITQNSLFISLIVVPLLKYVLKPILIRYLKKEEEKEVPKKVDPNLE
jgi:ACR3 family arsenite efflux pump ArsB